MKRTYLVVLERAADDNWGAFALDIPGAVGAGSSSDEARKSLLEGMAIQLEDIAERGLPAPLDVSTSVDFAEFDPDRTQTHYIVEWLTVELPEVYAHSQDTDKQLA